MVDQAAEPDDPKLLEFLSLMKARSTVTSYANDEALPSNLPAPPPVRKRTAVDTLPAQADADDEDDDDEEYQDLTARVKGTVGAEAGTAENDADKVNQPKDKADKANRKGKSPKRVEDVVVSEDADESNDDDDEDRKSVV